MPISSYCNKGYFYRLPCNVDTQLLQMVWHYIAIAMETEQPFKVTAVAIIVSYTMFAFTLALFSIL